MDNFIDARNDLDAGAIGRDGAPSSEPPRFDKTKAAEALVSGADYHNSTLGLLGKLASEGIPINQAVEYVRALFKEVPEEKRDQRWQDRYDEISRHAEGIYHKEGRKSDDPQVSELNETYALVKIGDKVAVLCEEVSPKGVATFSFMTTAAHRQWLSNRAPVPVERKNKAPIVVPLSLYWINHPHRRQYKGIVFQPGMAVPGYYNLWRGFAVESRKGDCSKFLAHIKDNVCGGKDDYFNWVIAWFAAIVQHPARKNGTSLVLRGKQGVGKTKVGEVFGALLGLHYSGPISNPRYITGQFNSHLVSCILLHADEGFWAGDHAAEAKLKDLITGESQLIEFKGKEPVRVDNAVRLLVTGNADWIVPAGPEERRFAVFEVGEDHLQDKPYFAAIDAEMDSGGREALLYHLLNFDLSGIDLRTTPKTAALLEQKVASMTPEQQWWLGVLDSGRLPYGCQTANCCVTTLLFDDYNSKATKAGVPRRNFETRLGIFLHRAVPGLFKRAGAYTDCTGDTKDGTIYEFPDLPTCREAFVAMLQQPLVWSGPVAWVDGEPTRTTDEGR